MSTDQFDWDIFVSHASEDKGAVVRPLVKELKARNFRVWYDEHELTVGDRLRQSIDLGLARSRFGIVVLSQHFFEKEWPQDELEGLMSVERDGRKVILPVWHEVSVEDVRRYSPILAGRLGASTGLGISRVADELVAAVRKGSLKSDASPERTPGKAKTASPARPVFDFDSFKKLKDYAESRDGLNLTAAPAAEWADSNVGLFEKHDFTLFKKLKNYAESRDGLSLTAAPAAKWAFSNLDSFEKHDFILFKKLKDYAESRDGLNLTAAPAAKWAFSNLDTFRKRDFSRFKKLKDYAESRDGLNLTAAPAAKWAMERLVRGRHV